jgi:hypothetical protein
MSAPVVTTPFINGNRYSFASIDIIANGRLFVGATKIAYGSSLKPGKIRGSDAEVIGRTPGEADHRCELELLQREFHDLIGTLGPGFGLVRFDVQVQFAEDLPYENNGYVTEGVRTHSIIGVRIVDVDFHSEEGTEANKVRLTLDPVTISYGAKVGAGELSIDWRSDIIAPSLSEAA